MALQMAVQRDGYYYVEDVVLMNNDVISKSKEQFEHLKEKGIILSCNYDDVFWRITNEVIKWATISFQIDEVHFVRETSQMLNCSLSDYQKAMRVVITSRFGFSVNTLLSDASIMRNFADKFEVPTDYPSAQLLADLLVLLPGDSAYRSAVLIQIDDVPSLTRVAGKQQRRLSHYQSYLRFLDVFDQFWSESTASERVFFFPIWFWLKITGVLPLRPTECVLTPRDCVKQNNGKYFLTVRRTKLKGTHQGSLYSINSDYELREYPLPEHLVKPILEYITSTQDTYESDIDVLFCKASQFSGIDAICTNDNHYTYLNLRQCLNHFYQKIIHDRFGFDIVSDRDELLPRELERINLGDTRHIAMVSLAISGGSPTICRELAGHNNIEISSHYYTNLTEFLDVLGYERFRSMASDIKKSYGITASRTCPVEGGYCQCEQVWTGDYRPCISAVDAYGKPGSCSVCRWFLPKRGGIQLKESSQYGSATPINNVSIELKQTCTLLKQAVEQLRQGLGNEDTLSCILDRLAAQAQHYVHASAMEQILARTEELAYDQENGTASQGLF